MAQTILKIDPSLVDKQTSSRFKISKRQKQELVGTVIYLLVCIMWLGLRSMFIG